MLTAEERARGQRLGAALRQARGDRSMVEVAALAGVPVETLRKIETGRIPTPAFFTVVALAEAVGISLGRLAIAAGRDVGRDAAALWAAWAPDLVHQTLDAGHFMAEEAAEQVTEILRGLLKR